MNMSSLRNGVWVLAAFLVLTVGSCAWAEEAGHSHEHGHGPQLETLTGEVVDVGCYLSHPESGQGAGHAECAQKCIKGGLPVALKVGDVLYLAVFQDHEAANQGLAPFAGKQVVVKGETRSLDGQNMVVVHEVSAAQ